MLAWAPPLDDDRNDGERYQEGSKGQGRRELVGACWATEWRDLAVAIWTKNRAVAHRPAASVTCVGTTIVPMTTAMAATTKPATVRRVAIGITYRLPAGRANRPDRVGRLGAGRRSSDISSRGLSGRGTLR
jgi:hypothetical protein